MSRNIIIEGSVQNYTIEMSSSDKPTMRRFPVARLISKLLAVCGAGLLAMVLVIGVVINAMEVPSGDAANHAYAVSLDQPVYARVYPKESTQAKTVSASDIIETNGGNDND